MSPLPNSKGNPSECLLSEVPIEIHLFGSGKVTNSMGLERGQWRLNRSRDTQELREAILEAKVRPDVPAGVDGHTVSLTQTSICPKTAEGEPIVPAKRLRNTQPPR
jgi:hypothetical protein